MDDLLGFAMAL